MLARLAQTYTAHAFSVAAFSILGLLFVTKPTTLVPSIILLIGTLVLCFSSKLRMQMVFVFKQSQYKWIARAFLFWFCVLFVLALVQHEGGKFYFPSNALRMLMATVLLVLVCGEHAKKWLLAGMCVAGFIAAIWAICQWPVDVSQRVIATTNNAIHFGNL